MRKLKNVHPGEILLHDFIIPMGLSQTFVAKSINVPPRRINEIVLKKRAITADTDLRLSRFFGVSEGFWLGLQSDFDLEECRPTIRRQLDRVKVFTKAQQKHSRKKKPLAAA